MNREELRENLARMTELFCGRFGYEHVPLGDSLIADELTTALRGFSTHRDRRKSDYIAVYLTGHGDLRGEREHVLLTRDSRPDDLHGKALPTADIGRLMLAETSVRRLLLILDTCYSGQGGAELAAQALKWSTWPEAEPGDGVVVVAASQPRELAKPEAFTTAFVKAAESEASAGLGLPATPVTAVVNVVRGDPDVPETQRWSPGNFVDTSIMLLLVSNCQIGARNPLGLSCRADVVSGRDCNIARCSRTRRS